MRKDSKHHTVTSRRSLLRGGAALGFSAVTSAGLLRAPAVAEAEAPLRGSTPSGRLVLNYQPSQPTGWPPMSHANGGPSDSPPAGATVGATLGGHQPSLDFAYNGTDYRIGVLPSGSGGDGTHPVYEAVPSDAVVAFKETVANAFGTHYAFHYLGGLPGGSALSVESYSVFAVLPTQSSPSLNYGLDIYCAYRPDPGAGDPIDRGALQWIQVVNWGGAGAATSRVDNSDRANPYYTFGGSTSVYGKKVVNFVDVPQVGVMSGPSSNSLSDVFRGEAFLVRETDHLDPVGRRVVDVLGGVRYGWQVQHR